MIDKDLFLTTKYSFDEANHQYYWDNKPVDTSVTQFIKKYFKEFDTEGLSKAYAEKHGLLQEDVKKMWKESGDVSALAGTAIHAYLESEKTGIPLVEDYSKAISLGLEDQVKDRVKILMPKAEAFINDTKDLLVPLATEYTVGLEDKLAGNIDLLAWNNDDNELQIWDYKNVKALNKTNSFQKCFAPFNCFDDCNFIHYSMQLSFYKAMLQKMFDIKVGKLKLVHFNYTTKKVGYNVLDAIDLTDNCNKELDKLLPKIITHDIVNVSYNNKAYGNCPF